MVRGSACLLVLYQSGLVLKSCRDRRRRLCRNNRFCPGHSQDVKIVEMVNRLEKNSNYVPEFLIIFEKVL